MKLRICRNVTRVLILHADGEEEEDVLGVLAVVGMHGNDVHARKRSGHLKLHGIAGAGTHGIYEVTVVEGDNDILALVLDGYLVVARTESGFGSDPQATA